jgi:hypothetical protein
MKALAEAFQRIQDQQEADEWRRTNGFARLVDFTWPGSEWNMTQERAPEDGSWSLVLEIRTPQSGENFRIRRKTFFKHLRKSARGTEIANQLVVLQGEGDVE